MISTSDVSLGYGNKKLFDHVNIKFVPGNCYGLIGANGSGKSTFIKILSGDIESQSGQVNITKGERLSVLSQDHYVFDEMSVLKTTLMGNKRLVQVMEEKEVIYAKPDFSDEDGIKASELEAEFGEMNGWEAESQAGILLSGLGIPVSYNDRLMKDLNGGEKVKVLLAQALFGNPNILLLDEPTNHLDIKAISWLENFLLEFKNTVIVVSHDRHFLNKVCTHIADIDFSKITIYPGNYDFWKTSSELALRLRSDQKQKTDDKAKELKSFILRFSANASKSKQATSRQKQLEKLEIVDLPSSTRKYPYIVFQPHREAGKELLRVEGLSKTIDGVKILDNVSFSIKKGDKVAFLGGDVAKATLFEILMEEVQPDSGVVEWGVTTTKAYLPSDNSKYFNNISLNIVDWLRQFSDEKDESFIRGFLGRMLFAKEEALKKVNVLSGGEKVRCMLSKMMLSGSNVLIFDGPTNHLDLESITAVNEGVKKFSGTVLFTSHDHEFMQTIAERIIDIRKGTVFEDKYSSYEDYLESQE
jgi:ATPase subunit of ABC transporter with duplicated ATPase domains